MAQSRRPRACYSGRPMSELVFFYGTLMTGFDRRQRLGMDDHLAYCGRGWIQAALFDLGLYPAAVPDADSKVTGEVFRVDNAPTVLAALDEIEGYEPGAPDTSLYVRRRVPVQLEDGSSTDAWAYFYNAPLGRAPRIASGDYLQYLRGSGNVGT
jgi:gamma-glutamylcyclotransferase (GGCT)/AIG2-like uncharacterized protein YtfP